MKPTDLNYTKNDHHSKGKTPDGTVFNVPFTREMVQSLLDPKESKSYFDIITLTTLSINALFLYYLPKNIAQIFFLVLFIFWRLAYNLGLGYLLKFQSDSQGLVKLAKRHHLFDKSHPRLYTLLKTQLSMKMKSDYDFDASPIEYNTWLLFRQLVDLILMNDFMTYICFAISWFNSTPKSSFFMDEQLRWLGGIFLIVFNIWVKLDAQRVVKDFAWYWGDFFFLIEQSLTFDGVFEMAPHPMYSVGYIGYYGISLICASYAVLFVSIFAHALQMVFLIFVETPHIEKTYNPPNTPKRQPIVHESLDEDATILIKSFISANSSNFYTQNFHRNLIVFKNLDFFQASDLAYGIIMVYAAITPFLINGKKGIAYSIFQTVFWRLFHSAGLGWLLYSQSKDKFFTRHFVKWSSGVNEAFQNWKSIYNFTNCMIYISFITLCIKLYSLPSDWTYGMTLLRHTLGLSFIGLHIWTSVSIYEVLGDFGWFYGDFFIDDHPTQLLYTGIYRFLNNPEKIMGHAAFWGFGLITNNRIIFGLALFSQVANALFLQFVERPHMEKLYGDEIRKEAGLTKTLKTAAKKTLPKPVQNEIAKLHQHITKKDNSAQADMVADFSDSDESIATTDTLQSSEEPASQDYQLNISHYRSNSLDARRFVLGERIKVDWIAPENHGSKDWIGIYPVSDSSENTYGKWYYTQNNDEDTPLQFKLETNGTVVFNGSKLPWHVGTFEMRYYHDGKYKLMAKSTPFEIVAPPTPDMNDIDSIQVSVLKLVQNVLDNNPEKMPMTPIDDYTYLDEQGAKKVAYAIQLMFGVEFAWEVILADSHVSQLSKRIVQAMDALLPFPNHNQLKKRSSFPSINNPATLSDDHTTTHPIAIAIQSYPNQKSFSINNRVDIHDDQFLNSYPLK